MKESVKVLQECAELQTKKSQDYQNEQSNIVQAMHYRRGVDTIHDMIWQKLIRAQSLLEAGDSPNFESLEDSAKDLINYSSFFVAYCRHGIPGQDKNKDVEIGSYPFFHAGKLGVSIVLRSENQSKIDICNSEILKFIRKKKIEVVDR